MKRYVIINSLDELVTFISYLKDNGYHGHIIPENNGYIQDYLASINLLDEQVLLILVDSEKMFVDLSNARHSLNKDWDNFIWHMKQEYWVCESMREYLDETIHLLKDFYPDWEWAFEKYDIESDCDDIVVQGKTYVTGLCMDPDWPDEYCRRVKINNTWYYFE